MTILNAAHGKKIGSMLDGCKVGELPVFGVNLTYGRDIYGVPVSPLLAVKTFHKHLPDGTLNIPLTTFKVPGCEEEA